ncbi:hypothetical protein [Streptomyces sp. KMM 9044]|uniref:hypothetical protein n=1 Tax=Streptomyces sp. KMM 9044 TaxID=2744474 RepID=UPI002151282B|nr:hypothetical protein [Streptomyces sp. KMM 9044]WAX81424.1 hypothetical protein HUV60_031080 [Streptomyces sp. KMM 9044]
MSTRAGETGQAAPAAHGLRAGRPRGEAVTVTTADGGTSTRRRVSRCRTETGEAAGR